MVGPFSPSLPIVVGLLLCFPDAADAAAKRASFMGQQEEETHEQAKSPGDAAPLFPVFVLSLIGMVILPWSIAKVCALGSGNKRSAAEWSENDKKATAAPKKEKKGGVSAGTIVFVALWIAFVALWFYVSHITHTGARTFDPFSILDLDPSASERAIKKAYRNLSLQYHPDKNPSPDAATKFQEISNAYRALTDPVARENLKKHGHPDGPMPMDVGIALPNFVFEKGTMAPLVLAALMGMGVLLPLAVAVWFTMNLRKYTSTNVNHDTLFWYSQLLKPSMALSKMPELLITCREAAETPCPQSHAQPMDDLAKLVRPHIADPKNKDKEARFWKRKASFVKIHMLLLAHLDRLAAQIPKELLPDLDKFLETCPKLIDELIRVALTPRRPLGHGWLAPAMSALHLSQCIVQAVPVAARKVLASGKPAPSDISPLLQLPGVDADAVKKMSRAAKAKDTAALLSALRSAKPDDRMDLLEKGGVSGDDAKATAAMLDTIPLVACTVRCETPGEPEICEDDLVTIHVKCLLTRPGMVARARAELAKDAKASADGMEAELLRKSRVKTLTDSEGEAMSQLGDPVAAMTPHFGAEKEEGWWVIVADAKMNSVLVSTKHRLTPAEDLGYLATKVYLKRTENSSVASAEAVLDASMGPHMSLATAPGTPSQAAEAWLSVPGHEVKLQMQAPRDGKHELTVFVLSDTYIGCDVVQPFVLKVAKRPAESDSGALAKALGFKDGPAEAAATEGGSGAGESSAPPVAPPANGTSANADDDDSDGSVTDNDADDEDHDWDSEETGTSESEDEEEHSAMTAASG